MIPITSQKIKRLPFSYSSNYIPYKVYKVSKKYVIFWFLKNICVLFLKIVLSSMI
jgi:hypothetical protein